VIQPDENSVEPGDAKLPAFEVLIERGKIREFAAAAQSTAPGYSASDAVTPATFLITASQWAPEGARADVGFDRRRLLHGEQEFRFFGPPPRAGQRLWASDRIADRYEKSGGHGGVMRFAVVVTEFRDEHDQVVAEARRTLIERAARSEGTK
jgi:hypothetical protein